MSRYIARLEPVEAERVPDREDSHETAVAFEDLIARTGGDPVPSVTTGGGITIRVMHEWRTARPGDWIIWRGSRVTEILSPEVFNAKYEAVE